jgi:CRP/FNR family transcriptional regulator, cyclic AMP receptor protein
MSAAVVHSATMPQSVILTSLTDSSTIGFIASALVLAAFGMKDMVNLRIVAICSNIAFITYALVLNLLPILILHTILLPLNGWRLMGALQQRRSAMGVGQSSVPLRPVADFIASITRL